MLKVIAAVLFVVWIGAVIMGKGGLYHIILLNAVGVSFVEFMTIFRSRSRTLRT
jgi:hypothetical protein